MTDSRPDDGSDRLKSVLAAAKIESDLDRKHWTSVKDQYHSLDKLLETLPDERVRECMVPISKVAFCPGRLIHTNEITALLGDGYFAEVSVKTARKLVEHRLEMIEERLDKTETAATQIFERENQMNELNEDIIKEDLNEVEEKELEEKRVANRPLETKIEEMRKLQNEKLNSMREKWNETVLTKPVSINKTSKTENPDEKEKKQIEFNETLDICRIEDLSAKEVESEESEPEEPIRIEFKWSKMSKPAYSENENEYKTPWDIYKNYKRRIDKRKQSILKVQKNINEVNEMSRLSLTDYKQPPISTASGSSGSFSQRITNPKSQPPTPNMAVSSNIVERDSGNSNFEMPKISSSKKKVSLFKQRRQKT